MNIKTINLTGTETAVKVGGGNAEIRNNGTVTIYAASNSGIVAGADGVVSIPAGTSVTVTDTRGTVYILGTGSVEVVGKDWVAPVFKAAAAAGGVIASNPNLLINSNFKINQRGKSEYTGAGSALDCWKLARAGNRLTLIDGGVELGFVAGSAPTGTAHLFQKIENYADFAGKTVTASANVLGTTSAKPQMLSVYTLDGAKTHTACNLSVGDNSITANIPEGITDLQLWIYGAYPSAGDTDSAYTRFGHVKLELGGVATPYIAPIFADELARCQRYYQIRSTGDVAEADMRPSMRTITDIKQREDGSYEYIAEL